MSNSSKQENWNNAQFVTQQLMKNQDGKRQNRICVFQLRTRVSKMDRQMSCLWAIEYVQGNPYQQ